MTGRPVRAVPPRALPGRLRLAVALLAAVLLAGAPVARGGAGASPVAVVGDRALMPEDLVRFCYDRYRDAYVRAVDDLVDETVALEDARRLGLAVAPAVLARAVDEEAKAREAQLRATYGEGADLAALVLDAYGVDVPTWRGSILRPRLNARLLLQRVVRWDARRRPVVTAKVVVLEDPARAAQVLEKLRAGADVSLTAMRESKDPTAKTGGTLPPIARGDLAYPDVEARLFAAAPGSLVGPLEVLVDGRRQWHVYKVVRRQDPWPASVPDLAARLEADLAADPVERAEYEAWRRRVARERGVRWFAPDGKAFRPPGR